MCDVIVGHRREIRSDLLRALMAYRYDVFVRRLGWRLPAAKLGWEQDEFDTDETIYILCVASAGQIQGCARLLPATGPNVLLRLMPELSFHRSNSRWHAWELSRFAAEGSGGGTSGKASMHSLAMVVFGACLQTAEELGGRRVVGVVSPAMERLLRRSGVRIDRLGAPRILNNEEIIVGCSVELSRNGGMFPRCDTIPAGKRVSNNFADTLRVTACIDTQALVQARAHT